MNTTAQKIAILIRTGINNYTTPTEMAKNINDLCKKDTDALQAKIDALMFEYCPGEMEEKQIKNYIDNQKPVE